MNITSKITAACAFDAGAVADAWQNSPASDYSLDYELGARFQHAKDQRIILALAAQLENTVKALAGVIEIGKRDMTNSKYDGYFDEAKQALTDVRKFMEGLGHE